MKNEKEPEIRFKGFDGEWEQRKLKDISQINPKCSVPEEFEYVDLESVVGIAMISHRIEKKDTAPSRAQRLAESGDIFYQTVRPYQKNNLYFEEDQNSLPYVFSTGYAQIRPNIDGRFLFNVFQTKEFVSTVLDKCTGTGYPAINSKDLSEIAISFPETNDEQKRIGEILYTLDQTITAIERKIAKLRQIKDGFLLKMFPREGEVVPEIRFKGFTGPWEQRKLKEIGKVRSGVGFPESEQGGTVGIPFYKVSDMNLDGNETEMTCANNYVTEEQILDRKWTPITEVPAVIFAKVGAAVMLNRKRLCRSPFLLDNNTMSYSLDVNVWDTEFSKALFGTIDLTSLVQVGALPSYNARDVDEIKVMIPILNEQKKIGTFFHQLDQYITLHQRKCDKLKAIKEGLLVKMFV